MAARRVASIVAVVACTTIERVRPTRQLLAFACLVVALGVVPAMTRASAGVNGGLTQIGCVDVTETTCEGTAPASESFASEIVPSPDGNDVYVLADLAIHDVRIGTDGTMTLGRCWASPGAFTSCDPEPMMDGSMRQFALSSDGRFAYLAIDNTGPSAFSSLTVFARDPASGALSAIQCIGPAPSIPCPDATPTHVYGGQDIALSPDGRYVDVFGDGSMDQSTVVSTFARAADGTLSEIGCLTTQATSGCVTSPALTYPAAILDSPDGAHVYAVGGGSIVSLARDGTGTLHEIGCLSAGATADTSCHVAAGADGIESAVLAPDGTAAYAFNLMGLWNLRTASDGTLQDAGCGLHGHTVPCVPDTPDGFSPSFLAIDDAQLYTPNGGIYPLYMDHSAGDQSGGTGITSPSAVAASPAAVYYFANGSLFAFSRVPPIAPLCLDAAATIARPSGTIAVQCTDPRGQPLTFTLDAPPAHGTVVATAGGSYGTIQLQYVPAPGSATSDSFTFHVDDGLATGAEGTVRIAIAPASTVPTAKTGTKALTRVALTLGSTGTLRVRHGATTLAFRCGRTRCTGTVALLRSGHTVVRARFNADKAGRVRATLRLPRSLRPSGSHRVHLRLRVTASAKGFRPHTVERAISLATAAG
jgi:Bacterial Ig domain